MPDAVALPEDPILLSAAAALLGVAPCSVWRWVQRGLLRGWRVGCRWRVSRAEALGLVRASEALPEVAGEWATRARLAEVDRELREAGIRR